MERDQKMGRKKKQRLCRGLIFKPFIKVYFCEHSQTQKNHIKIVFVKVSKYFTNVHIIYKTFANRFDIIISETRTTA